MRYQNTAGPPELWFPALLRREGECLIYTGAIDPDGYGQLPLMSVIGPWGRTRKAHRLAFALARGYLPQWPQQVCHTCDNPPCCESAHLYDGSPQQNHDDMVARGRSTKGRQYPPSNIGEKNHFARLDENTVRLIREARLAGAPLTDIAQRFNVSVPLVSMIANRKLWRHIE